MPSHRPNGPLQKPEVQSSKGLGWLWLLLAVAGVAALVFRVAQSRTPKEAAPQNVQQEEAAQTPPPPPDDNLPVEVPAGVPQTPAAGKSSIAVSRPTIAATPVVPINRPEPSPFTRDLVSRLSNLDQNTIPRTPEQVAAWKQNLQQLVQQGAAAVPAIREFLDKNMDLGFGTEAGQGLGFGSARYAMMDALAQIGGPEATQAMLDTLQTVADPREIALLAKNLDRLGPDAHRQEILDATRQALAMAGEGKLPDTDVGPLFEVMYKYGGAGILPELEQDSTRWRYYSAIALAQLPDGAGVPSLIRMVQDPAGGPVKNVPALEMLTQSAAQSPDAAQALQDLVRDNKIPSRLWPYLTAILGGDRVQYRDSVYDSGPPANDVKNFHIAAGNQNFYSAPAANLSQDDLNRQLKMVENLLGITSDPSAIQALQTARNALSKRLQ